MSMSCCGRSSKFLLIAAGFAFGSAVAVESRVEPLEAAVEQISVPRDESAEETTDPVGESAPPLQPPKLQQEELEDLIRWTGEDAWRGDMPAVLERLEPWVAAMRIEAPDDKLARSFWQRLATAYVALERPLAACEALRQATRLGGGIHGPAGSWASPRMERVEKQCAKAQELEVP